MPEADEPVAEDAPEIKAKILKTQREHFETYLSNEKTYVILVAVHKDSSRNIINRVSCKKGISVQGYTYDTLNDTYQIECTDYVMLGFIPFSMKARLSGVIGWEMRVPMVENVIKRFLTPSQKRDIKTFVKRFKPDEYTLQFVQLIDPNA